MPAKEFHGSSRQVANPQRLDSGARARPDSDHRGVDPGKGEAQGETGSRATGAMGTTDRRGHGEFTALDLAGQFKRGVDVPEQSKWGGTAERDPVMSGPHGNSPGAKEGADRSGGNRSVEAGTRDGGAGRRARLVEVMPPSPCDRRQPDAGCVYRGREHVVRTHASHGDHGCVTRSGREQVLEGSDLVAAGASRGRGDVQVVSLYPYVGTQGVRVSDYGGTHDFQVHPIRWSLQSEAICEKVHGALMVSELSYCLTMTRSAERTSAGAPAAELAAAPSFLDDEVRAAAFLDLISSSELLAIDTEGASFHRFVDRIYLMQLSTSQRHAIVDPLRVSAPALAGLGEMLESPRVEVVFHDADYDLRLLRQDYGWRVVKIFDTRVAAQLLGIRSFGLATLLERFFGVKLDKRFQRADWSLRPLSSGMLEYASQDTMHLLPLREQLRADLVKLDRLHWAQEEFDRLEGTRWEVEEGDSAFLRVKGARDLTRRELALLRELVTWRDSVAKSLDRSAFRVVGNDVLLDMAQRPPASAGELGARKGLGGRIASQEGKAIMDAIERGRSIPEAELPRFPRARRWDRDADFEDRVSRLRSVRDERAHELDLDPGVLCGRERLEAIARRNPRTLDELAEVPDVRRWQIDVLGSSLIRALSGAR